MGELHSFNSPERLNIDYSLGLKIYDRSSELWVEAKQKTENPEYLNTYRISEHIDADIWSTLKKRLRDISFLRLKDRSANEIQIYYDRLINEADTSSPFNVYISIQGMLFAESIVQGKMPDLAYLGMKAKILKTVSSSLLESKLKYIESGNSAAISWHKDCGKNENNVLFNYAIQEDKINKESQRIFIEPSSKLEDFNSYLMSDKLGQVIEKCVVFGRNHQWFDKITNILNSNGPPIAILVGIGHLSGKEGLINLLKTELNLEAVRLRSDDL